MMQSGMLESGSKARRGDGGASAPYAAMLLEPDGRDAERDHRVEVPIPHDLPETLIEASHGGLRQRRGEAEEDAGRRAQEPRADRWTAPTRESEQKHGDADAYATHHRPDAKGRVFGALGGLTHDQQCGELLRTARRSTRCFGYDAS